MSIGLEAAFAPVMILLGIPLYHAAIFSMLLSVRLTEPTGGYCFNVTL